MFVSPLRLRGDFASLWISHNYATRDFNAHTNARIKSRTEIITLLHFDNITFGLVLESRDAEYVMNYLIILAKYVIYKC